MYIFVIKICIDFNTKHFNTTILGAQGFSIKYGPVVKDEPDSGASVEREVDGRYCRRKKHVNIEILIFIIIIIIIHYCAYIPSYNFQSHSISTEYGMFPMDL